MTPRCSFLLYFVLGLVTDVLVVLYYRMVQSGNVIPAVVLSALITLVPLFVVERGISAKDRRLFVAYAFGAGAGTALGMIL
jgi:hypothetical protein